MPQLGDTAQLGNSPLPFNKEGLNEIEPVDYSKLDSVGKAAFLLWQHHPLFLEYNDILIEKYSQLPLILEEVDLELNDEVVKMTDRYGGLARNTHEFLFKKWMPIGYASMISLPPESSTELNNATIGIMRYGQAVTLMDDVCDSDACDTKYGKGFSEHTALFLSDVLRGVTPSSKKKLKNSDEKELVDEVLTGVEGLRAYLRNLPSYSFLEQYIEDAISDFAIQGSVCRSTREKFRDGTVSSDDIKLLMESIPHGMTVLVVGLLSLAHFKSLELNHSSIITEMVDDFKTCQLICHYQNCMTTLPRELHDKDPNNSVILKAFLNGQINPVDYMNGKTTFGSEDEIIKANADKMYFEMDQMIARMEKRITYYKDFGLDSFFKKFLFGVHNLGILYEVTKKTKKNDI